MSHTASASASPSPAGSTGERSNFAAGAKLSGELTVPGLMEVSGSIDGKVTADSIMVEAIGSVVGELHADSVAVQGCLEGIIYASDVKLHSSAKIHGEIFYQTLSVESGADLNASCVRKPRDEN